MIEHFTQQFEVLVWEKKFFNEFCASNYDVKLSKFRTPNLTTSLNTIHLRHPVWLKTGSHEVICVKVHPVLSCTLLGIT